MQYDETHIRETIRAIYCDHSAEIKEFMDLLDKISKLPEGSTYVRSRSIDEHIVGSHIQFTKTFRQARDDEKTVDVEISGVVTGTTKTREGLIVVIDGRPILMPEWDLVLVKAG